METSYPSEDLKWVAWNKDVKGFQKCWLWQFGEGPFEIVSIHGPLPNKSLLGINEMNQQEVWVDFQPGRLFYIKVPDCAYWYKTEWPGTTHPMQGLQAVLFHEKWFVPVEKQNAKRR